jgi:hypothetical protein
MIRGRALLNGLLASFVTLAALELVLRLLPSAALSFERWLGACEQADILTPLHHMPYVGPMPLRLDSEAVYGRFAGRQYEERYDEWGIKSSQLRPQDGDGIRILFMGDSFIQGYDDANTIPQQAYEWITRHRRVQRPIVILNAAYSSYSPVIFTVQAKRLLPVVRPDFVVVDIDETDLYDDAVRYRDAVVRDEQGRLVAVGRNRDRQALVEGCARVARLPLYLLRLAGTLYYQSRLSLLDWWQQRNARLFAVAETAERDVSPELLEQIHYFSTTLDELFATLKQYLPADRILIVRHPHLRHLQKGNRGTPILNRKVGELVAAAAARSGIAFFDAQDELAALSAGSPEAYYWDSATDMHFNFEGMRAYGELVGRELARKLDEAGAG